jgi:hypothetical protein
VRNRRRGADRISGTLAPPTAAVSSVCNPAEKKKKGQQC